MALSQTRLVQTTRGAPMSCLGWGEPEAFLTGSDGSPQVTCACMRSSQTLWDKAVWTTPVDQAACAEDNDSSLPRPTRDLRRSWVWQQPGCNAPASVWIWLQKPEHKSIRPFTTNSSYKTNTSCLTPNKTWSYAKTYHTVHIVSHWITHAVTHLQFKIPENWELHLLTETPCGGN